MRGLDHDGQAVDGQAAFQDFDFLDVLGQFQRVPDHRIDQRRFGRAVDVGYGHGFEKWFWSPV